MTALAAAAISTAPAKADSSVKRSSFEQLAAHANQLEQRWAGDDIRKAFDRLRLQVLQGATADSDALTASAIALMSLAVQSLGGPNPYDVQRRAAAVMARGGVAEMATGEGKTRAVALAAAVIALTGRGVHVATANDYLARRDCALMGPAFAALGLRTSLVEPHLSVPAKQAAYASDVVYATADTFAFDFLRDVVTKRDYQHSPLGSGAQPVLLNRRRHAIVIDEIDHILIDEASTPLVLSIGSEATVSAQSQSIQQHAARAAAVLIESLDWTAVDAGFRIRLTAAGEQRAAQLLPPSIPPATLERPWVETVQRALEAEHRVRRDVDYVVQDQQVQIVDPATGRINKDRRWQDGLHQAVEYKEGLAPTAELEATAQITRWRFFDLYERLAGCSGTAWDARLELWRVYRLPTVRVPLRCPSARRILPTKCFADTHAKFQAIADDVQELHRQGRPVLLGTENIQQSHRLAEALVGHGLMFQLLNGIQSTAEARVVAAAGAAGAITIATDMAGRGTDILLTEQVLQKGGLHVIVVSPRASLRLDRQLIGRAARQGQPGSARTYISADDTLIVTHAPWVKRPHTLEAVARRAAQRADRQAAAARFALATRDRRRESFFSNRDT